MRTCALKIGWRCRRRWLGKLKKATNDGNDDKQKKMVGWMDLRWPICVVVIAWAEYRFELGLLPLASRAEEELYRVTQFVCVWVGPQDPSLGPLLLTIVWFLTIVMVSKAFPAPVRCWRESVAYFVAVVLLLWILFLGVGLVFFLCPQHDPVLLSGDIAGSA